MPIIVNRWFEGFSTNPDAALSHIHLNYNRPSLITTAAVHGHENKRAKSLRFRSKIGIGQVGLPVFL